MRPEIIELPKFIDRRGNLSVVEENLNVPFTIRRVYYIYDVPGGESRGEHAHKNLSQLIIAISGSFTVVLDDGIEQREFFLNKPYLGLTIPPGYWRKLEDFSSGSVALVICSELYDPDDYIFDYEEFLSFRQNLRDGATSSR